jgi:hypothetical protein
MDEVQGAELEQLDRRMREIIASAYGVEPSAVPWSPSTGLGHTVNLPYKVDRAFRQEALNEMLRDPLGTAEVMALKAWRFWFGIQRIQNRWAQPLINVAQGGVLLFAALGVVSALRSKAVVWPLLATVFYLYVIHILTYGALRYSMPVIPIIMVFSAAGVLDLWARMAAPFPRLVPPALRASGAERDAARRTGARN